jgi:hypothetical protein
MESKTQNFKEKINFLNQNGRKVDVIGGKLFRVFSSSFFKKSIPKNKKLLYNLIIETN